MELEKYFGNVLQGYRLVYECVESQLLASFLFLKLVKSRQRYKHNRLEFFVLHLK